MLELKTIRINVTAEEIFVEVPGGIVSSHIRRPARE
jgi:hypothetical protein